MKWIKWIAALLIGGLFSVLMVAILLLIYVLTRDYLYPPHPGSWSGYGEFVMFVFASPFVFVLGALVFCRPIHRFFHRTKTPRRLSKAEEAYMKKP